jgi:hypothetical protein
MAATNINTFTDFTKGVSAFLGAVQLCELLACITNIMRPFGGGGASETFV